MDAGAEIIDIGAESTSPKATAIDEDEEWRRLQGVLSALNEFKKDLISPIFSLDSRRASIAKKACEYIDWINDVTGLDDPLMRKVIREKNLDCIIMHHKSIPERRDDVLPRHIHPFATVYEWGKNRIAELEREGIKKEKIIFDPGIGFGKMAEQSWLVLQEIEKFKHLGVRVLVGHSRKTFFELVTAKSFSERDIETYAMTQYIAQKNIDYIRVHDVSGNARMLRVAAMVK